jgi:hypothetical protein
VTVVVATEVGAVAMVVVAAAIEAAWLIVQN